MSVNEEIGKAISAHGQWKRKLKLAIDTGECESTPERVKQDCNCAFGQWLHNRIDPNAKASPFYRDALNTHAEFHREAGSILELALNGEKDAANERMALGSTFSSVSARLTRTMTEWQNSLAQ